MLCRERRSDRFEIVAGIKTFRYGTDSFPERLPVAQKRRTGERVDLCAGIIDVILAGHAKARERKQVGECVAEDRAAAMADMHGSGWIGGNVFDVDRGTLPGIAA